MKNTKSYNLKAKINKKANIPNSKKTEQRFEYGYRNQGEILVSHLLMN